MHIRPAIDHFDGFALRSDALLATSRTNLSLGMYGLVSPQMSFKYVDRMPLEVFHVLWHAFSQLSSAEFGILDSIAIVRELCEYRRPFVKTENVPQPFGALGASHGVDAILSVLRVVSQRVASSNVTSHPVFLHSYHIGQHVMVIFQGGTHGCWLSKRFGNQRIHG